MLSPLEVKNLNVYVFDKNGKYFDTYTRVG